MKKVEVDNEEHEHGLNLRENNFALAFQVQDFQDESSVKNNNAFVKWNAKYVKSEGIPSEAKNTFIGTHPCTPADFKAFY